MWLALDVTACRLFFIIVCAFCIHLYFTVTALFGCMEHQGTAWLEFSMARRGSKGACLPQQWGLPGFWSASRAVGTEKSDQKKCKKWMWCPSAPKHWSCNGWEVATGATGCPRCQGDGSQGAWSTFQFQHLKLCWDKLLSAVSLNICSPQQIKALSPFSSSKYTI